MEAYGLDDLTQSEYPSKDEIIRVLRELLHRKRATGCAIIINAISHVEDELEPTTGARRQIDMLLCARTY
ncbi:MAG TPA: hypothetical protein VK669_09045 [Candidatus Limnocylindrales bacterium]|nr:hypothetical protein [Candidatus Limnocylindrales bacterium]